MRPTLALLVAISFTNLGSGDEAFDFDSDEFAKPPPGWFVPTAGYSARVIADSSNEVNRLVQFKFERNAGTPMGNLMRNVPAQKFRGRHVRLTANIKVDGGLGSRAQMWLRVDRANRQAGDFDNMGDRPVRPGKWTDILIEADIDEDAESIAVGFMSFGNSTLLIDNVQFQDAGPSQTQRPNEPIELSPRQLEQLVAATRLLGYIRFFAPTPQVQSFDDWDRFAIKLMERVEPEMSSRDFARQLQTEFQSLHSGVQVWAGDTLSAPAVQPIPKDEITWLYWEHQGVGSISQIKMPGIYRSEILRRDGKLPDNAPPRFFLRELGAGVSVRLPLCITLQQWEQQAALGSPEVNGPAKPVVENRHTRFAEVACVWNVFQHFYPYFDVVDVDWLAALRTSLRLAASKSTGRQMQTILETMTAKLNDGHVSISSKRPFAGLRFLPMALRWHGDQCIVVGVDPSFRSKIAIGDVVESINGVPADVIRDRLCRSISGSTANFRHLRCSYLMASDAVHGQDADDQFEVQFVRTKSNRQITTTLPLRNTVTRPSPVQRPSQGEMVADGIVYFNLVGTETRELIATIERLRNSKAIVFDLRGYPSSAASALLPHLTDDRLASARWTIPRNVAPDQSQQEFIDRPRWDLRPAKPRLSMPVAFMTDESAISYAESIMGIVEHYQLGEIVGSTTAGTNGNVNPFLTPLGTTVSWTGMRVLKHDGSQHHGIGIQPTVKVLPTPAGVAAGTDEVLEKAILILEQRIAESNHP